MSKQLNAFCNFQDGLLICQPPEDTVEVELKVKTAWGKHNLLKD